MKVELTVDELRVLHALVNSGQWAIAKHIVALQDKCAAALKEPAEPATVKKGA